LWGTVPITARQATEDDVFEGIHIPKDTIIHFPTIVINSNHALWGDDADEFRPDRWDELKNVLSTQLLTFQHGMGSVRTKGVNSGLGPRACIGRKFAETEMRVLLAILVGSSQFAKVEGFKVEKYSLITMRPKNGLQLHVSRVE